MTTYYTPPHVLDPAAGSSAYLADIVANPPWRFIREAREIVHEVTRPAWHAPVITHMDVTRTMAWCGSGEDVTGGEV